MASTTPPSEGITFQLLDNHYLLFHLYLLIMWSIALYIRAPIEFSANKHHECFLFSGNDHPIPLSYLTSVHSFNLSGLIINGYLPFLLLILCQSRYLGRKIGVLCFRCMYGLHCHLGVIYRAIGDLRHFMQQTHHIDGATSLPSFRAAPTGLSYLRSFH